MKSSLLPTPSGAAAPDSEPQRHGRRRAVLGAGVAAAGAALAVAVLPRKSDAVAPVAGAEKERPAAEGYRLTDHIRRYYETTRS